MKEQEARAAADKRLRRLEDDELDAHLAREMQIANEKKAQKKKANDEYHRQTAKANREAKVQREAAQKYATLAAQPLNAHPCHPCHAAAQTLNAHPCHPFAFLAHRALDPDCVAQGGVGRGDEAERDVEGYPRQAGAQDTPPSLTVSPPPR